MHSDAATVSGYLDELPEDRRAAIGQVLALVRANLPEGYDEVMRWGMITWEVPLAVSGPTYNGKPLMYAALASQKRHMALYLCGVNCLPGVEHGLRAAYAAAGRKLDLGKACLRFRKLDDLLPEAVAAVIAAVPVADFAASARR
ncbi:MAG: DUF1801 domain-containing protein [Rhodobacteraceae bacterium]|nr:DUF1801 domain-containing protein [Paracoccaceae bacterium]